MTISIEDLDARLAMLEARAGVAPLAANPPITIGELTDVPAPGSAIASAWAQEVSGRVVQRFANLTALNTWAADNGSVAITLDLNLLWRRVAGAWRPFPGQIVNKYAAAIADIAVTTAGQKDIVSIGTGSYAFPTTGLIWAGLNVGFGSGQINFSTDVFTFAASLALAGAGAPTVAGAGAWAAGPVVGQWSIPAAVDAAAKLRVNISTIAGTCHTGGYLSALWVTQ